MLFTIVLTCIKNEWSLNETDHFTTYLIPVESVDLNLIIKLVFQELPHAKYINSMGWIAPWVDWVSMAHGYLSRR